MSKFQLPCPCGAILPVSIAQAGTSIPCPSCGNSVEVPGTKELRKLEPAVDAVSASKNAGANNASWLRRIAALLFLCGLCSLSYGGLLFYQRWQAQEFINADEERDVYQPFYEHSLTDAPATTWDHWKFMVDNGLPKPEPLPFFTIQRALEARKGWMYGCLITGSVLLALFGIVSMIASKSSKDTKSSP